MGNLYRPCVGMMLLNRDKKVFVGRRYDTKTEAWQMPQGGIDAGEDIENAMFRELKEEIGVTKDKVKVLGQSKKMHRYNIPSEINANLWKGRYIGQEQRWFLLKFIGNDRDINIHTKIPEFKLWRWVNIESLVDMIIDFKKELYHNIIEEFKPLIEKHFNETQ